HRRTSALKLRFTRATRRQRTKRLIQLLFNRFRGIAAAALYEDAQHATGTNSWVDLEMTRRTAGTRESCPETARGTEDPETELRSDLIRTFGSAPRVIDSGSR